MEINKNSHIQSYAGQPWNKGTHTGKHNRRTQAHEVNAY